MGFQLLGDTESMKNYKSLIFLCFQKVVHIEF